MPSPPTPNLEKLFDHILRLRNFTSRRRPTLRVFVVISQSQEILQPVRQGWSSLKTCVCFLFFFGSTVIVGQRPNASRRIFLSETLIWCQFLATIVSVEASSESRRSSRRRKEKDRTLRWKTYVYWKTESDIQPYPVRSLFPWSCRVIFHICS